MNRALLIQLWIFAIGFLFSNLHKRTFDPVFRSLIALPVGWAIFGISATLVYGVYFGAASQVALLCVLALVDACSFNRKHNQPLAIKRVCSVSRREFVGSCGYLPIRRVAPNRHDESRFVLPGSLWPEHRARQVRGQPDGVLYVGPLCAVHTLAYQSARPKTLLAISTGYFSPPYCDCILHRLFNRSRAGASLTFLRRGNATSLSDGPFGHFSVSCFLYPRQPDFRLVHVFGVFALAKLQQEPTKAYGSLALLSLIAFSLVRIEAPLFAIAILLVTTFRWQGWAYGIRLRLIIPYTLFMVAWYARVYFMLPEYPDLLTKHAYYCFHFGFYRRLLFSQLFRS